MKFSPDIRSYLMNLIELHDVNSEEEYTDADEEYVDEITDAMDGPWYRMSERDRKITGHISALLNALECEHWVVTLTIDQEKQ